MDRIRAIVFDLDDTLFDCTGQLVGRARRNAARAMVQAGFPKSLKKTVGLINQAYKRLGPKGLVFESLAQKFAPNQREKIVAAAWEAYRSGDVPPISLFADAVPLLDRLRKDGFFVAVITSGSPKRQRAKIRQLKLAHHVDEVIVHDVQLDATKEESFRGFLAAHHWSPGQVVVVGDQIRSEIRIGNWLGMVTIRLLKGHYASMKPEMEGEMPDFVVRSLSQVYPIVRRLKEGKNGRPRIVLIGGGTGLSTLLRGLKSRAELTAIVGVTDNGRSTGVLRREYDVIAPGDIRNCLTALASSEKLKALFDFRFSGGKFDGMSFGNLFLTALTKTTGSFERAVEESAKILAIEGEVLPATLADIHIRARLSDGTLCESENEIVLRQGRPEARAPIERVWLHPKFPPANPRAIEAIRRADLIVLGPGSLFSSVITNLLIPGIRSAVRSSAGKKVFICNVMSQPGQSHGFSVEDHVAQVEKYLGRGVLDVVLYNSKKPSRSLLRQYASEGSFFVGLPRIKPMRPRFLGADLIERNPDMAKLWEKKNLLRHDSKKIAHRLLRLLQD